MEHPYSFKIIRLEPGDKRIGLSLKEASRRERQRAEREERGEPQYDGASEGSGASMGEIAGLRAFSSAPDAPPAGEPAAEVPPPPSEEGGEE